MNIPLKSELGNMGETRGTELSLELGTRKLGVKWKCKLELRNKKVGGQEEVTSL